PRLPLYSVLPPRSVRLRLTPVSTVPGAPALSPLSLHDALPIFRLADDVPDVARFAGAVDICGVDRDRLRTGLHSQLRVLGFVRGLGGLRGLGLIVGLLGVSGTVLGLCLFTLIGRLRALSVLCCGLLAFIGAGARAESEESGNGNGGDRSGAHVSIIGEQWGRRRRKPVTTNV